MRYRDLTDIFRSNKERRRLKKLGILDENPFALVPKSTIRALDGLVKTERICWACLHYGEELAGDLGSPCDRCRNFSNFM